MIKINFEHLDNSIELEVGKCNILVIEDSVIYSKIIYSIFNNRRDDYFKIFDNNYKKVHDNSLFVILNPLTFDFNDRALKNLLYDKINYSYNLDQNFKQELLNLYEKMINNISNYIYENEDIDVTYNDTLDIKDILKAIGLNINVDSIDNVFDKISTIIQIIKNLFNDKIVILSNLNNILSNEQLNQIIEQINLNCLTVLLIESGDVHLVNNKYYKLDNDFFLTKKIV